MTKNEMQAIYNIHKKFQNNQNLKGCYITPLSYSSGDCLDELIKLGYEIKDANTLPGVFLITNKKRNS